MLEKFKKEKEDLKLRMESFVKDDTQDLRERFNVLAELNNIKKNAYEIKGSTNPIFARFLEEKGEFEGEYIERYKIYTYETLLERIGYAIDESDEENPQVKGYPTMKEILEEAVNSGVYGCKFDW